VKWKRTATEMLKIKFNISIFALGLVKPITSHVSGSLSGRFSIKVNTVRCHPHSLFFNLKKLKVATCFNHPGGHHQALLQM
jgi:hypothetical protein